MEELWFYFVLGESILCGIFSMWLAGEKGYKFGLWFLFGLIFNIIALLAIGLAPDRSTNFYRMQQDVAEIADYIRSKKEPAIEAPRNTY
jgi:hypothetical protein